jgi:hypothetical protein
MLGRSSADTAVSDRHVIMNDLTDIRERLIKHQESAAEGLRNSTQLIMLFLPVVMLNVSCRSTRETASPDVCELQLERCSAGLSRKHACGFATAAVGLGE